MSWIWKGNETFVQLETESGDPIKNEIERWRIKRIWLIKWIFEIRIE